MRPKSGLPKRKALRRMPQFRYGFRENPDMAARLNPSLKPTSQRPNSWSVLSMFAGCGGFDLGLLGGFSYLGKDYPVLPFRVVHAYDNDPKTVETYRLNLGHHISEVDLVEADLTEFPPATILTGGFPCQDFSSSGPKVGLAGRRGALYSVMRDYMALHQPAVVVAENVPFLARLHGGKAIQTILEDFRSVGYRFNVWRIFCPDFGLPQSRTRLFLVGVRDGVEGFPAMPTPTHAFQHISIDDAIDDLEDVSDEAIPNQSQYFVATKATKGAGQGDHTSKKGELAYNVRANPKARVHFHYALSRRLTVRECARLQSFPDEFVFPHSASHNILQIGNAVPPIIGHVVGLQLAKFLEAHAAALPRD